MNKRVFTVVTLLFIAVSGMSSGQVLISLLLGDNLNSPKVEFGLVGGLNRSYFNDVSNSKGLNNFNLGFYFHINLKNDTYLNTGVLVKSNVGATGMSTYPLNNPDLDNVFQNGELTTKVSYFYLPLMLHQRFDNRWYVEGGIQFGPRNAAKDIFKVETSGGDLTYTVNTKKAYHFLDAGLMGGVGYKFKQEIKSLSAGVLYYYGLVDITISDDTTIKNSSFYFFLKIPIGAHKAEQKAPK